MNSILDFDDTIAAISTSQGEGAINIIRVSGEKSIKIVDSIYKGKKKLVDCKSHTINYGYIYDGNNILDEVLISIFKKPNSYTRENIVEINTHGGVYLTNQILKLIFKKGAREAYPGEFTQRAFLNGRINLNQAESVMDIIKSENETMSKSALKMIKGDFSKKIANLKDELLDIIGLIEVNIDYPEYKDIENVQYKKISSQLKKIIEKIKIILLNKEISKYIRNGINIAIIGRPNVGKSTLLNFLLNEDKAIVTDIKGTTRDLIEGNVYLKGIKLNFIDTAGIHETKDLIEEIGIQKTLKTINKCDFIIYLINAEEKFDNEDIKILEKIKNKKVLILVNKIDKVNQVTIDEKIKQYDILNLSLKHKINTEKINNKIIDLLNLNYNRYDIDYVTNSRQEKLLEDVIFNLENALNLIDEEIEEDLLSIDLKLAYENLNKIIGNYYDNDLLDNIFSRFCLGK